MITFREYLSEADDELAKVREAIFGYYGFAQYTKQKLSYVKLGDNNFTATKDGCIVKFSIKINDFNKKFRNQTDVYTFEKGADRIAADVFEKNKSVSKAGLTDTKRVYKDSDVSLTVEFENLNTLKCTLFADKSTFMDD